MLVKIGRLGDITFISALAAGYLLSCACDCQTEGVHPVPVLFESTSL